MNQQLLDGFKAYWDALSYVRSIPARANAAVLLLQIERDMAWDSAAKQPPTGADDAVWYQVQDMGDMSLTQIRQWLSLHAPDPLGGTSEDDVLARFQLASGKLADPLSPDNGPFYIVSHVGQPDQDDYRTSMRAIRRIIRNDQSDDNWNIYSGTEARRIFEERTGRTLRAA